VDVDNILRSGRRYRAAPEHRIGVATVYRTLSSLTARRTGGGHVFRDGKAQYERASIAPGRHLIDIPSGRIFTFASPRSRSNASNWMPRLMQANSCGLDHSRQRCRLVVQAQAGLGL
jgi:Fe2+ or Zn2+ uptake regulation protein